ncbi:MAG: hypothetical protein HQ471_01115 [Flavobacteriales bacterium]|jgi:hypothetical protein|nr:hypothetical protein [Flavobacteriales bacterium]
MEFFRIIDKQVSELILQEKITPLSLELFTETMFLIKDNKTHFEGATLWDAFKISYNKIKGGIRFTLLDCPNAFSWTITTGYPPEPNKIIIHCTINRIQKEAMFIEEINAFLDEWEVGLKANF